MILSLEKTAEKFQRITQNYWPIQLLFPLWSIDWLIDFAFSSLVDWWIDRFAFCTLTDWLIDWFRLFFFGWLVGWLIDWLGSFFPDSRWSEQTASVRTCRPRNLHSSRSNIEGKRVYPRALSSENKKMEKRTTQSGKRERKRWPSDRTDHVHARHTSTSPFQTSEILDLPLRDFQCQILTSACFAEEMPTTGEDDSSHGRLVVITDGTVEDGGGLQHGSAH